MLQVTSFTIARFFAALWLLYLIRETGFYWRVHRAAARAGRAPAPSALAGPEPVFVVLCACRDGADCLPGLARSLRGQDFPPARIRPFLVADNCTDATAAQARALGFEVYERHDPQTAGKGRAVSEALQRRLRGQAFDVLVVLDVDARIGPDFLRRAAAYFSDGRARLVSGATYAKNAQVSRLARVGAIIQALLRHHQEGRAALGLEAGLYGSHGYALSRAAIERLDWRTTTGQIAEDMELRLRAQLADIPVRYAPELRVYNDVTAEPRAVREQRRRWNATYLPLIPAYAGRLARQAFRGERGAWDALWSQLLLPSFANLLLFAALTAAALAAAAVYYPAWRPWALAAGLAALAQGLYFPSAFLACGIRLTREDWNGLVVHLGLRALALGESLFFLPVKDWAPAPHEGER